MGEKGQEKVPLTSKEETGRTLEVRLLALLNLLFSLDALDRPEQRNPHPSRCEVAVSEAPHILNRDGEIGLVGRESVAVDLRAEGGVR